MTASFYPMQFLAEQIGKDHVKVDSLTKPGVEPHDLEITPKQTAQLGEADVVVYLKSLQPAVDKAVAQSGVKNIVDAATLTELEVHGSSGHDHGAEEGHAEGEGHDHGHGEPARTRTSGSTPPSTPRSPRASARPWRRPTPATRRTTARTPTSWSAN